MSVAFCGSEYHMQHRYDNAVWCSGRQLSLTWFLDATARWVVCGSYVLVVCLINTACNIGMTARFAVQVSSFHLCHRWMRQHAESCDSYVLVVCMLLKWCCYVCNYIGIPSVCFKVKSCVWVMWSVMHYLLARGHRWLRHVSQFVSSDTPGFPNRFITCS